MMESLIKDPTQKNELLNKDTKLQELDKKYLGRSFSSDIEIIGTQGNYLLTSNNKKYVDFLMGCCVGNIGWGNQQIRNAIKNYNGPDYVQPFFLYKPWVELAELLAQITPGKLTKSFRATGGTEAVDIALQTANAYTKRNKFISISESYHGDSIGAMSIASDMFSQEHPGLLFTSYKIKPPFNNKAADEIEKIMQQNEIAAIIMEPILCSLGVVIPEQIFMTQIHQLCKKYGSLLIIDEVATGFGRTGKLFGIEHFGIEPDIMCFAKAITGGYAPMGALITTNEVAKALETNSAYYSTYGWHPLSVTVALANLRYLLEHQDKIQHNTQIVSEYFQERLTKMSFKYPFEIRIKGLAIGISFEQSDYAMQIANRALENGLLVGGMPTYIAIFPALNIDLKTAKEGLNILEKSINSL